MVEFGLVQNVVAISETRNMKFVLLFGVLLLSVLVFICKVALAAYVALFVWRKSAGK